jgi:signal transduction histidine kinase
MFPRRSGVTLEFDLDAGMPVVALDPKRFRRAISELVENALNHMETGGLCVCTRIIASDEVGRIVPSRSKRYARIEIEDTGPGVEADHKSLIFQPFFSNRVRGMGLGLSIVKGIVNAHGGEVYEEGEEGAGARFVIVLPIGDTG